MGILAHQDIVAEVGHGRLLRNGELDNIQGCSYDMRIGCIFTPEGPVRNADAQVVVPPGGIISLFTLEDLVLPDDVMGTAFPMNSLSSQGLLVLNPGHIDPGYDGPLTVRAVNMRATPKSIQVGAPIFTVVFQRLPHNTDKANANKPRSQRELAFAAIDVEQNPGTLFKMVELGGANQIVLTKDQVRQCILDHWLTYIATVGAVLATVATIAATVFAALAFFKTPPPEPQVIAPMHQGINGNAGPSDTGKGRDSKQEDLTDRPENTIRSTHQAKDPQFTPSAPNPQTPPPGHQ